MLGRNLKYLRKQKEYSQEQVAKALDIPRPTYSGYENKVSEPGFSMLAKLAEFFNVSIDQLLRSEIEKIGVMQPIDIEGTQLRVLATTVDTNDNENIEVVTVEASAGYTGGYADPAYIKVLPTFQMPFLSKEKKYRTFPISGDSMPPVNNRDYVTAEYVQNWKTVKNGQPYIVVTKDEGIVFKVVYNRISENGTLLLCSTNPLYQPYDIPVSQVLEVWKYVNYISSKTPEFHSNTTSTDINELQSEVIKLRKLMQKVTQGKLFE